MKNPNLIILAGITGLDKKKFVTNLLKKAKKTKNVLVIDFEEELVSKQRKTDVPTDMQEFLDNDDPANKLDQIEKNYDWIVEKINKRSDEITHIILCMHLIYFKNSEFYPPFIFEFFRNILVALPNTRVKIITIINDVFSLWNKIHKRVAKYPNTELTLYDILMWRSLELLCAQELKENIRMHELKENIRMHELKENIRGFDDQDHFVNNYIVSIKHPANVFINLIFKDSPKIIYISYHITSTRDNPNDVKDINNFRNEMYKLARKKGWVIFDPVTIDELSIDKAIKNSNNKNNAVIESSYRWDLDQLDLLTNGDKFPMKIPFEQAKVAIKAINTQIKSRDFMLVDTSDCLVVYRPYFHGELSKGVSAEIRRAKTKFKKVLIFNPNNDIVGSNPSTHPFKGSGEEFQHKGKLFKRLSGVMGKND